MPGQAARQARFIVQALRDERRSRQDVERLQNARLRAMVQHAYANSAFYRQKFDQAGLQPADIQTVADLVRLPPTTKQELQAAASDHRGTDQAAKPTGSPLATGYSAEPTISESTSGSSGTVLQISHSAEAYDRYFAFAFRHLLELGYRPWQRVAYTSFDRLVSLPWERVGLGVRHQVDLRQRNPHRYVEDLLRIRPRIITAYPSILRLVIQCATPAELAKIRPRAIHLHSELLTDGIRAEIRDAFGCDCFDDYSTFEFHQVAYECRAHTYHIAADNVVVEVVDNGRAVRTGEQGELLITGLTNSAMPLLRYAIGDIGALGSERCSCGRGFGSMQLLQGRIDDYVVLRSGRRFSPRMINPTFETLPGILEHVLVQETHDHIVAHLNVSPKYVTTTPRLVEYRLRELFAEPVRVEVRLSDDLERGRTGKLRSIVSKVRQT